MFPAEGIAVADVESLIGRARIGGGPQHRAIENADVGREGDGVIGVLVAGEIERLLQRLHDGAVDRQHRHDVDARAVAVAAHRTGARGRPGPRFTLLQLQDMIVLRFVEISGHARRIVLAGRRLVGAEVIAVPLHALEHMHMLQVRCVRHRAVEEVRGHAAVEVVLLVKGAAVKQRGVEDVSNTLHPCERLQRRFAVEQVDRNVTHPVAEFWIAARHADHVPFAGVVQHARHVAAAHPTDAGNQSYLLHPHPLPMDCSSA